MVTRIIMAAILVAVLDIGPTASAQTSSIDEKSVEIIDTCIEAMGGEMALHSVDTLRLRGEHVTNPGGAESKEIIEIQISGDRVAYEMSATDGGAITGSISTPEATWVTRTSSLFEPASHLRYREMKPWPHVVADWNRYRGRVRFVGEATVDEKQTWQLEFESPEGLLLQRFFDNESGLMVRQTTGTSDHSFEYRQVDDIQVVCMRRINDIDLPQHVVFREIEINVEIPDEIFEMPAEIKSELTQRNADRDE
ncbi:MAG: hypothetical protein ACR2NP_21650 [Pirellulaceae bacterium]